MYKVRYSVLKFGTNDKVGNDKICYTELPLGKIEETLRDQYIFEDRDICIVEITQCVGHVL